MVQLLTAFQTVVGSCTRISQGLQGQASRAIATAEDYVGPRKFFIFDNSKSTDETDRTAVLWGTPYIAAKSDRPVTGSSCGATGDPILQWLYTKEDVDNIREPNRVLGKFMRGVYASTHHVEQLWTLLLGTGKFLLYLSLPSTCSFSEGQLSADQFGNRDFNYLLSNAI